MFVLSNQTVKGGQGAIIHFLKFYNMLAWEKSYDLNFEFPTLNGNFLFR